MHSEFQERGRETVYSGRCFQSLTSCMHARAQVQSPNLLLFDFITMVFFCVSIRTAFEVIKPWYARTVLGGKTILGDIFAALWGVRRK